MPPKALKQILFPIESTGEFLEKIDKENAKVVGKPVFVPIISFIKCLIWIVIDMYLSWCGPCDCIEQNYRGLGAKYDGKVEFYTASEDVIPEDIKMKLKEGPLTCQPRFVVFVVSANNM